MNDKSINSLTFIQLWEEYDLYIKVKLKPQSYRKEKNSFLNHIVPYFKDYLVIEINAKIYLSWLDFIEEKYDYSASFKKSLHGFMVSILNYAVNFYDLKKNIASKVGGFNYKKGKPKSNIEIWTLEEYTAFINAVDNPIYKNLFITLYFTALRLGECLALTWNDFIDNYLDINKTISKEKNENGQLIMTSPKTESSKRRLILDTQVIDILKTMKEEQQAQDNFSNDWFIFGGSKPLSQTTIGRVKNKYCEKAGVKKIRLHDFRHSHATLLLSKGVPITVIAQRLGHSDIATTLNIYSHLVYTDIDKAINILNKIKH